MQNRPRTSVGPVGAAALIATLAVWLSAPSCDRISPQQPVDYGAHPANPGMPVARNVVFFVGDGMGMSTVTVTRIQTVGVAGSLELDRMPHTALVRTHSADYFTTDSAASMTAMISGQKTASGVIGYPATTELADFNRDGNGTPVTTLIELAKAAGKAVGVVTSDRVTGATPAACYAHINNRARQLEIPLQALPGDAQYNQALGTGLDLLAGGGRAWFLPTSVVGEEGVSGRRTDGRDLRAEFQQAGFSYVWNRQQWLATTAGQLPALGLFDSHEMDFVEDRERDPGGNPTLAELTSQAISLLAPDPEGFVLVVESARIDHAHHGNNVHRAVQEMRELDDALAAAMGQVNLQDTLVVFTTDHGQPLVLLGYSVRPLAELPYPIPRQDLPSKDIGEVLGTSFFIDHRNGLVRPGVDRDGIPFVPLVYGAGPGYRDGRRADPWIEGFPGFRNAPVSGPLRRDYRQEAALPASGSTHSGEDVPLWAAGAGADAAHGVLDNTEVFTLMRTALGL